MAVIQISKIQQRRGQKLQTGIPQLSSGELAWAVDTQELFIGNGSLAEGAPYVGNTKLLTEHDNILELANSYRFANDDTAITYSISRSLQSKIDEIEVSVLDFGTGELADGSTNCSEAFHKAFSELFQNSNERYRKVLIVPNGRYIFTEILTIPSNVILKGETRDGVVLDVTNNGIVFVSENGTEEVNFSGTDRPENILISNLTIYSEDGEVDITGLKSSIFDNVKFLSDYTLGQEISTLVTPFVEYDISRIQSGGNVEMSGTFLNSVVQIIFRDNSAGTIDDLVAALNIRTEFNSTFVASRESEFLIIEPIIPENYTAGDIATFFSLTINNTEGSETAGIRIVEASSGIENTNGIVSWRNVLFDTRVEDVYFKDCVFEEVGLAVKCLNRPIGADEKYKTRIFFQNCKFFICDTAVFVESPAGQVNEWLFTDCIFEEIFRNALYSTNGTGITVDRAIIKNCGNGISDASNPIYPIFKFDGESRFGNVVINSINDRHQASAITNDINKLGISETQNGGVTSFSNDYYSDIEPSDSFTTLAVFSSTNRYIELDYILTLNGYTRKGQLTLVINDQMNEVAVSDSYIYSSQLITSLGGSTMTDFEFDAILRDNNSDSINDTTVLQYKNPQGPYGFLSYTLTYGV